MRLLMLFTLGFCAGSGYCGYLAWDQSDLWPTVGALCLLLFAACLIIRKRPALVAAVCLLGVSASMLWYWGYDQYYLKAARQLDQATVQAEILVEDYSFSANNGVAADGSVSIEGKRYSVRLYLYETESLSPGDRVQGQFRFRYTAAGSRDGATFHQGDGILLLAYSADDATVLPARSIDGKYFPVTLRKNIISVISDIFPQDTAAFATALLIGEDSGLSYEENTVLKLSGIRHVVAVSGQHLVILLGAIMMLTGRSRRIACYLCIPVTILFSVMAGMTPSILRACIMQLVMMLAFLSKKDYDGPTALSFSVLLMVVNNPLAVTSVSLQLSVGSIIGMFAYSTPIYNRMRKWYFFKRIKPEGLGEKLLHWLLGSISVTLGSMVITVPLSAVYFRTVSLVGIVTNLLTLWLITLVFYGVIVAVIVGAVWGVGGGLLAKAFSVPIRFVLRASHSLSCVPGGCLFLRNEYMIIACTAAYGLLLLLLHWKQFRIWMGACMITCVLFLGIFFSWMEPYLDNWRITMLDVGQGQCILLQSGERTYMVDCGGDYGEGTADMAAETLLSMGITRLDGLILTHFDTDHISGAEYLLSRIQVDTLLLPEDTQDPYYERICAQTQGNVVSVTQDIYFGWDGASVCIFAANGGDKGNEMSLCVLFQSENCAILITGDRSKETEMALLFHRDLPELDYLVAGHHGADSSTADAFLAQLKPKTVLISVGKDNRYGHPSAELLQRLKDHGCKILRTDLQGTILIRG